MKNDLIEKIFSKVARIGAAKNDSEETKLQKSPLVICAIPFSIAGAIWGIMYMLFGELLTGMIPVSCAVFSASSIVYFGCTGKFGVFRFSQLLLILLLPFSLMLAMGGFINSSVVILWGLLSPLGATLFYKQSSAPR